MFANYCLKGSEESSKAKKLKADEKIQEIITLIQFANGKILKKYSTLQHIKICLCITIRRN